VVIEGEQVLFNHGIRQAAAAWRYPEALLQRRQRQVLSALALLQKGNHQLKGGHPHRHVQRLDYQPCSGVTFTPSLELLHELPPAPVREEVALAAAMQKGPRFWYAGHLSGAPDRCTMPWAMAAAAIGARKLADPVATDADYQSVMVQSHRHLALDQDPRHR
jgi:hypothetical protein